MTVHRGEPQEEQVEAALIGFARALAAAGVPVDAGRTRVFVEAALAVGVQRPSGVYWAGRACLCGDPDQFPRYDAVFDAWFATRAGTTQSRLWQPQPVRPVPVRQLTSLGPARNPDPRAVTAQEEESVGTGAADRELLRHRDLAELTADERVQLADLFAALRPLAPQRRSARRVAARRGRLDARRLLRDQVAMLGEPGPAHYRGRATRDRPVSLLIDVSGSMAGYADALIRLAHVWRRAQPRTVEVFTIGTRLTRITTALTAHDPQQALQEAGDEVPDWSGGTRLGEVLTAFLDRWGSRSLVRGATVVIFSDGWERGGADLLGGAMARLDRLAHRVIWVNPHRDRPGYRPVQAGIVAALPYCDEILAGHSIATFERLLRVVAQP
jgi:uncharacterized protein with von Willebrand factor type A (vWA) domain